VAFAPAVPGVVVAGFGYSAEATSFARLVVAAAGRFDLLYPSAAAESSVTATERSIGRCRCKVVDTRSTSRVSTDERETLREQENIPLLTPLTTLVLRLSQQDLSARWEEERCPSRRWHCS